MSDSFERKTITPAERETRKLFRQAEAAKAMTEHERALLLADWNDTASELPSVSPPDLFAQQVARTPDAIAVVHEDYQLTYAELAAQGPVAGSSTEVCGSFGKPESGLP